MSQHTFEHADSGAFAQVSKAEAGISFSPSKSSGQLILTHQPPLSPLVEIHADDTAHRLWRQIALNNDFQRGFVAAVGVTLRSAPQTETKMLRGHCRPFDVHLVTWDPTPRP